MKRSAVLRILDANFNRSREGLRVCEEVTRFVMEDAALSRELKKARHAVSDILVSLSVSVTEIVEARDVKGDVGKEPSALEYARKTPFELFVANIERVKESLRVLEEVSKFLDETLSAKFKKVRFHVYSIEKKTLRKLEALPRHKPSAKKKS
jgi:thiamine-phosphate pyrophosphorylase